MPRLLFTKTGNSVWMSHLDLMRLFQRAFKRSGLLLKHTQGFNPRPSVSIALPLSVGVDSVCELLDFDLDGKPVSNEQICERLNRALTEGVQVLRVYDNGRKLRDLALLRCKVALEYDGGVPTDAQERISQLFARDCLTVPKKTKNGMQDQDIISMIRSVQVRQVNDRELELDALVCCQNPTLNPAQLSAAICMYVPSAAPDHSRCSRLEIYDNYETIFR